MKSLKKAVFMVLTALFLISAVPAMADNITMYAPDGRTAAVEESDVQSWQSVGWYTYPVMNIYSVYNSFPIAKSDWAYWQGQGWYAYPVMNVYSVDGSVVLIAQSDLWDWQNKGWYTYPVMNVYAPDGRVAPIAKSDLTDWQNVGWYAYPVMNVYASNGQVCVIAKSDLADWEKMGWYAAAEHNEYNNNNQSNQAINNSSQYQQSMSYNMSTYEKLKSQIMEKGVKTDSGVYGIVKTANDMTVAAIYDPKKSYIGFSAIVANSEVHLFVYDDKAPEAVCVVYLDDGSEVTFRGVYTSSQITVTYSPYPETNVNVIKTFNSSYPIFDFVMLMNGIDVKISDFGIAY